MKFIRTAKVAFIATCVFGLSGCAGLGEGLIAVVNAAGEAQRTMDAMNPNARTSVMCSPAPGYSPGTMVCR